MPSPVGGDTRAASRHVDGDRAGNIQRSREERAQRVARRAAEEAARQLALDEQVGEKNSIPESGLAPKKAAAAKEAAAEATLDDYFEMLTVIGKGSFGSVALARSRTTEKFYAIKTLQKDRIEEKGQVAVATVKTERDVLAMVDHPNIVKLHYAFQTTRAWHFVMDFCAGGELFTLLSRDKAGLFMRSQTIRFYAAAVFLALQYLHRTNVIFCDLKSENLH